VNAGRASVVVSFAVDDESRAVLDEVLGDVAELVLLPETSGERRAEALERADALLVWHVGEELDGADWEVVASRRRAGSPGLFLQLFSAGLDHVPFGRVPAGVTVAGNVGGWAEPMAEHVLAMVLALAKRLFVEHEELRRGAFNEDLPTRELRGRTCAVIGYGAIGRAVAVLVRALGMRVYAVNTSGTTDDPVDFAGTAAELEPVLRAADVVVLTLPLTAATRGLIGARELAWMRDDAVLVNVARGAIVDEAALYHHLREHPDFSAGLDVWWDEPAAGEPFRLAYPFLDLPNVLGSPHNSGIVDGWFTFGLRRAAANVRRRLLGEPVVGIACPDDYVEGPVTL
jgi:phosphoglycerate dehydrogenase-like enzyme